jgi:hypothetical protein
MMIECPYYRTTRHLCSAFSLYLFRELASCGVYCLMQKQMMTLRGLLRCTLRTKTGCTESESETAQETLATDQHHIHYVGQHNCTWHHAHGLTLTAWGAGCSPQTSSGRSETPSRDQVAGAVPRRPRSCAAPTWDD